MSVVTANMPMDIIRAAMRVGAPNFSRASGLSREVISNKSILARIGTMTSIERKSMFKSSPPEASR